MIGEDGQENVPHRDWMVAYDRVLTEFKAELAAQGREDEFVGSKMIYSTKRDMTCEVLEWFMEDCLMLKLEFPHLICGKLLHFEVLETVLI